MQKLRYVLAAMFISGASQAGIITHTDYTAGSVITSAGQNTNENTIVNEFNGNIDAANLAANAVNTSEITDLAVTLPKLSANLQSTFTFVTSYLNAFGSYRRPVLKYISITQVDVENNTGTANETCILFTNESRCVTENTSSTNKYRRFDITATANFTSGTEESGLLAPLSAGTTKTFEIYAVKSQVDATKFVLVGDTTPPTQANYATLNTVYGTNGWIPLGYIFNGNNAGTHSSIVQFEQAGAWTTLFSVYTGTYTQFTTGNMLGGVALTYTSGATSLGWTYASGMTPGTVPPTIKSIVFDWGVYDSETGFINLGRSDGAAFYERRKANDTSEFGQFGPVYAPEGFFIADSVANSTRFIIGMKSFIDGALTGGLANQL